LGDKEGGKVKRETGSSRAKKKNWNGKRKEKKGKFASCGTGKRNTKIKRRIRQEPEIKGEETGGSLLRRLKPNQGGRLCYVANGDLVKKKKPLKESSFGGPKN